MKKLTMLAVNIYSLQSGSNLVISMDMESFSLSYPQPFMPLYALCMHSDLYSLVSSDAFNTML